MPIQAIVLGALAGAAALVGIVKGTQGVGRIRDAKRIGERAQARHQTQFDRLLDKRAEVAASLQAYGETLARLNESTLDDARRLLERIQQMHQAKELRIPAGAHVEASTLGEFRQRVLDPPSDALSAVNAVSAGAAAGSGTLGLVGLLGAASTGTAIGTLSGAAATNATLAWLGGGSIAAGGGGMAAGTLVLGGVVAGPALAVAGLALASKGAIVLTQAQEYDSDADQHIETLRALVAFLSRLQRRALEMEEVALDLDARARKALSEVPVDFNVDDDSHVVALARALQLVKALSDIMQTPLLNEKGDLTIASEQVVVRYRSLDRDP